MKRMQTKKCKRICSEERAPKLVAVTQKYNKNYNTEDIDKIVCPITGLRCKNMSSIRSKNSISFK